MADCAFDWIKRIYAKDVMLNCSDFNKHFDIHTDSSEYQMETVISQNRRPVAYCSKKLMETQRKYPTTDEEMLTIVECLKQHKSMLLDRISQYGWTIKI